MNFIKKLFQHNVPSKVHIGPYMTSLLSSMRYEVIPTKSSEQNSKKAEELPLGCPVSVTCSPQKGIAATVAFCEQLAGKGHSVVMPHIAARMVEGPEHVKKLAQWMKSQELKEVMIVGGDADDHTYYHNAIEFMRDFIAADPGIETVMFAAYPDGHPVIDNNTLHRALREKQEFLNSVNISGIACTQLCFCGSTIKEWLKKERSSGFTIPVHIGLPGVIDRKKLIASSFKLGLGAAFRFIDRNRCTVTYLFAPGGYDPTEILIDIGDVDAEELLITGIHSCTFNEIAATAAWQQALLSHNSASD